MDSPLNLNVIEIMDLFPLADILAELLEVGAAGTSSPVEIEFAINLHREDALPASFGFLQMRPMMVSDHDVEVDTDELFADNVLLAAGQTDVAGQTDFFLSAVNTEDGTEIWRQELPAAAVKGGSAIDHKARILVSLQDGQVLCFAK